MAENAIVSGTFPAVRSLAHPVVPLSIDEWTIAVESPPVMWIPPPISVLGVGQDCPPKSSAVGIKGSVLRAIT